jgi:hypothetical protein
MNLGMALGTGGKYGRHGRMNARHASSSMSSMTAETEKRLALFYQVIGNGTMRIMAESTIFLCWRMLIYKRPLFIRMTVIT